MARLREDGYWEEEVNVHGFGTKKFIAPTPEALTARIEKFVASYGTVRGGGRGGDHGGGRPKGTTKAAMAARRLAEQSRLAAERNRQNYEKEVSDIYTRIMASVGGAVAASRAYIKADAAKEMLKSALNFTKRYDKYTGNLDQSFTASIVRGRRVVLRVTTADSEPGNGFEGRRVKIFERRHNGKRKYRYKKKWERKGGYANTGITAGRRRYVGIGKQYGDPYAQGGVVLENAAPYASAVEAKGYPVLPYGIERSYAGRAASRQKALVLNITNKMLKAARLI